MSGKSKPGQAGSHTTQTDPGIAPTESGAQTQPSQDPQLRKVHEVAGMDDEEGRGNDVPVEQGGARHRQK